MLLQTQKFLLFLFLLAVIYGLTGCARIQANVSAFSTLPLSGALRSMHVMALPESVNSTLEWAAYKKIFEQAFEEKDYTIAPDKESADYVAVVEYDLVSAGHVETTETTPVTIGDSVRYLSTKRFHDVYRRTLFMTILAREDMDVVYEGRVASKGDCGSIPEVMHELVEALFKKFPRGSGKVNVFGDFNC